MLQELHISKPEYRGPHVSGSTYELVRVAMTVLKGVDGKQVELQENTDKTYIQWRYTDGDWTNLIAVADIKGNEGEKVVFRTGSTGIEWKYSNDADTAYQVLVAYDVLKLKYTDLTAEQVAEITGKTPQIGIGTITKSITPSATITANGTDTDGNPKYLLNVALPQGDTGKTPVLGTVTTTTGDAGTSATAVFTLNGTDASGNPKYDLTLTLPKGVKGDTGYTPVLQAGTVVSGTTASASVTQSGTDSGGNPIYKINLTLPIGATGKTPQITIGSITTGAVGSSAAASITSNGTDTDGNPKYLLNLTIPKGEQGIPGTGSGNVSADGTSLVTTKQYLFVPSSNGSTAGTFVEYTAPSVATTTANGLMSSSDKSKLDGVAAGANNYTHPAHDDHTSGFYKITVDALGHVTAVTPVTKTDITSLGIPAQDTTYSNATKTVSGLMYLSYERYIIVPNIFHSIIEKYSFIRRCPDINVHI